jgi:dihydrolipoamide dehydrogenase
MEFADVYAAYGAQVTVLEALPRVLPIEDEEVSAQVARVFTRRGVDVRTGVTVKAVTLGATGAAVDVEAGGKAETLAAEQVLVAIGRAARTRGIGLDTLGVEMDRGFVNVSPSMETSVKGIYAIGDIAGNQLLAHKAMAEGVVAAETIAGHPTRPVNYGNIPACTYCRPQVASVGLTEARARETGREIAVGRFPFTANGKAVALADTEGFLKVVADGKTGELLGVHIVGPEATELIHEFVVGRTLEATLEEFMHTVHAHPTLSEAALEAVLAALGQAIHL